MSIENKPDVVTDDKDNTVDTPEDNDSGDTTTQEDKKGKPSETLEAREARLERQLEQTRKKLGKEVTRESPSSNSSDLGERAYLAVNGIKTPDEIAFFNKMKKETGRGADALLESTYFQAEFREFKEKKATQDATPTGSKRSNNSSVDSVDYWLAKDELPPASEVELRRKVVNARINKETSKGMFYNS